MTAQVFSIPIDGVPEGWEPVAFRDVCAGEWFFNPIGKVVEFREMLTPVGPRLILRKKYTPPAWLKEAGFKAIWRDEGSKWYASVEIPIWSNGCGGYYRTESVRCRLTPLNFTPPELPEGTADKDTLIEL